MRNSAKTVMGAGGAGLMVPAVWVGVVPVWVAVVVVIGTAVMFLVREAVSQWIRLRACLTDPVGTHRVEAGVPATSVGSGPKGRRKKSGKGKVPGKGRSG